MTLWWRRRTPCSACHIDPAKHGTLCTACNHYALTLNFYATLKKRSI